MHDLLHRLVAQYSLANDKAARLWQLSRVHDKPVHIGVNTERGLGMVAALLLGVGLIFWIAANWQDQSRQFKFYLIQGVLLATMAGALAWPRERNPLLLLSTLAPGSLLAFLWFQKPGQSAAWRRVFSCKPMVLLLRKCEPLRKQSRCPICLHNWKQATICCA